MAKKYLIIYETKYGELFKTESHHSSKKEAIKHFKEHNTKYGYRIIAIREITSDNIYL